MIFSLRASYALTLGLPAQERLDANRIRKKVTRTRTEIKSGKYDVQIAKSPQVSGLL